MPVLNGSATIKAVTQLMYHSGVKAQLSRAGNHGKTQCVTGRQAEKNICTSPEIDAMLMAQKERLRSAAQVVLPTLTMHKALSAFDASLRRADTACPVVLVSPLDPTTATSGFRTPFRPMICCEMGKMSACSVLSMVGHMRVFASMKQWSLEE